jgi:long-chain fatty acid transport protein
VRALVSLLVLLAPLAVHADEGRYQDYAVGARALGLGGAFTALADDASGVFYNPAGIVDASRAKISISTSLYGVELVGASALESATNRIESGVSAADLIIIPSATGYVAGLGAPLPNGAFRHAWAFGTRVPQYQSRFVEIEERLADGGVTRFRSTTRDRTLHAGLAYGFRAGPWLRVGASAQYVLRTLNTEEELVALGADPGASFLTSNARLRTSIHSLRFTGGAKLWPGPRWRVGVSVLSPTLSVYRDGAFRSTLIDGRGDAPAVDEVEADLAGLDFASVLPLTVRAGVAFLERGDFALSADVVFHGSGAYELVPLAVLADDDDGISANDVPIPLEIVREPVVNAAFGAEKYLADNLSVSAGAFTNFSAAPKLQTEGAARALIDGTSRLSNIHTFGASLSLGLHTENVSSRLGVTGSLGFGDAVRASPAEARVGAGAPPLTAVKESQGFIYVFWSSSFKHGGGGGQRRFDL